jgi:hypothetical protein
MRNKDTFILENLYCNDIILKESLDKKYINLAKNPDQNKNELERIVEQAAKKAVDENPRLVLKFGQLISKEDFDNAVSKIKPLPRDIFYVGNVEVIRNPTSSDYRTMDSEVWSEFRRKRERDDGPSTRHTKDKFGNRWIWKAHQGMHSQIEPLIQRKEQVSLDQNNPEIIDRNGIIRDAIKSGIYISKENRKEFEPRYGEFYKKNSFDPIFRNSSGEIIPISRIFDI